MRVLICGNCSWKEMRPIYRRLLLCKREARAKDEPLIVISGMAMGADYLAWKAAGWIDTYCDEYPWTEAGRRKNAAIVYPKKPHMMRNQWMLDSGVDVVYGYAYDIRKSKGTRDMLNRCWKAGVPTFWYDGRDYYEIDRYIHDDLDLDELTLCDL